MIRKIIHINEEACNGCGLCASACHEGAIELVNQKAKLVREHFCDGLGDCLPACPTGAITIEEREAPEYDEKAVLNAKQKQTVNMHACPGSMMKHLKREEAAPKTAQEASVSQLQNWPVQIKLAPAYAPYFNGAKLLIAADCTAYAYASFHQQVMQGKTTLIGCPKLDSIDYSRKLTEILANHTIQEVTIVRMEVPCCKGLELAVKKALQASGKLIPCQVITITVNGELLT